MKPDIIYILGLGHSGSTMLQYLLACGQGTLGLGEVRKLVDGRSWNSASAACSCGEHVGACPAWSGLQPEGTEGETAWYRRTVDTLSSRYPDTTHWVDTSKTPGGLVPWLALRREGVVGNIRILSLVRDVRGWAVSDEHTRRRKGRRARLVLASILSWWRGQAAMEKFLSGHDLDFRTVSYEGMIFRTAAAMAGIADYTGIDGLEEDWETRLRSAEVHDVFGNRVKDDAARRSRLVYEDAWQYRAGLNLLALMAWPAWRMNAGLRGRALDNQA